MTSIKDHLNMYKDPTRGKGREVDSEESELDRKLNRGKFTTSNRYRLKMHSKFLQKSRQVKKKIERQILLNYKINRDQLVYQIVAFAL